MQQCTRTGEFFGKALYNRRIGDLFVSEGSYVPGQSIPKHAHELPNFCFVLSGGFEEISDRVQTRCELNTLVYRPGGQEHKNLFAEEPGRCLSIECVDNDPLTDPVVVSNPKLARYLWSIQQEIRTTASYSSLVVEALMLEVKDCIRNSKHTPETRAPGWIEQTRSRLRESTEIPSLQTLAGEAGVHPVHLAREFQRFFRCTPGEYVRTQRIRTACKELRDTRIPLGEIALSAGFADQAHFNRVFKQHMGQTPKVYRKGFQSS